MRGRPVRSAIRQNVVEILYYMKKGYGYEIFKAYIDLFPAVTMRSIYYHLNKGTEIGEFKVAEIRSEKGNFSWGDTVKKTYYALGDSAKPTLKEDVKKFFAKK